MAVAGFSSGRAVVAVVKLIRATSVQPFQEPVVPEQGLARTGSLHVLVMVFTLAFSSLFICSLFCSLFAWIKQCFTYRR